MRETKEGVPLGQGSDVAVVGTQRPTSRAKEVWQEHLRRRVGSAEARRHG